MIERVFTVADITPGGLEGGTTFQRFGVVRDDEPLGWVRVTSVGLVNAGQDPVDYIANYLSARERDSGFDALAIELAEGLMIPS